MSEKIDVNNSEKMFVTGVLYGLMFAHKVVMGDKIQTSDNMIVRLINEQYDSTAYKIGTMGKLISEHDRVPNLEKVYEEYESENKELKQKIAKTIGDIYNTILNGGKPDENK